MKLSAICSFVTLALATALVHAQTGAVNAIAVNGVLNPTFYAGSDIGAKVNTAWASGNGKTVRIPAGTYSFSSTISHPGAGYELICDAGVVLNYTGSSDAIRLPSNPLVVTSNSGIDGEGGCVLNGNASAQSGIHMFPSNHTFIRNMRVFGFSNGYGIYDTGANSVELTNLTMIGNKTAIYATGMTYNGAGYAANAIHLSKSEIQGNSQWGFVSENSGCGCTTNLGITISENVFESNGAGDVYLDWDHGAVVSGNYFESAGPAVKIGPNQNTWGMTVTHNYITSNAGTGDRITIGYGDWFNIEENTEYGATSTGCFVDVTTGSLGYGTDVRGVGTNRKESTHEFCLHGVGTTTP